MKIDFSLTLPIRTALLTVSGIRVEESPAGYRRLEACAEAYRARFPGASPGSVPGIEYARKLFRMLKIEPTRHRPSSEALLNRALKNKPLFSVNTLVDVGNWCSLDFLLPLGIYDTAKIIGKIILREGREGEHYLGLNRRQVNLGGRYLLADEQGPFGSPITDSQRTCVDTGARETLCIIYAPLEYPEEQLEQNARQMARRISEICGGEIQFVNLVSGEEQVG